MDFAEARSTDLVVGIHLRASTLVLVVFYTDSHKNVLSREVFAEV